MKAIFPSLLFSTSLVAQTHMFVNDANYEKMKTGYDTERQEFLGVCVKQDGFGNFVPGTGKASFNLKSSLDESRVSSEFGFSAAAKWRTGVTKYSIGADFVNNSASSNFSINSTYSSKYEYEPHLLDLGKTELNANGLSKVGNETLFRQACGNEFIYKQIYGAKLYFNIRIDFDSQKSKNEFKARFKMSGSAASASANLRIAKNKFSKRTRVTISAYQAGGDISKLTQIISGTDVQVGENSGYAYKECTFGNLTECEKVLERAITYATDTQKGFPSQLADNKFGPVLLQQHLKKYSVLQNYPQYSPQLTAANRDAMDSLNDLFEQLLLQKSELKAINNGIVRLSANQIQVFENYKKETERQLTQVVNKIEHCYHNLSTCLDNYNRVKSEIQLLTSDQLRIEKEVFAQECDYVQYFGQQDEKNTVNAIIEYAKKIEPSRFKPLYTGHTIDTCAETQAVIEKNRKIDLSKPSRSQDPQAADSYIELTNFQALYYFKDLEELSLKNASLRDISFLEKMTSLQVLNLDENYLRDISSLRFLPNLTILTLRDNRIKDISVLQSLSRLVTVDLRNNSATINCPQHIVHCQDRDYSNYVEISPKFRALELPARQWHQAVTLGERVALLGGIEGGLYYQTQVEVMDQNEEFSIVGHMKKGRDFFTAHRISQNQILAIGGLKSHSHAEILYFQNSTLESQLIKMRRSRYGHTSVSLSNGDVVVTGGFAPHAANWSETHVLSSAEIFRKKTQRFEKLSNMNQARAGHTMTVLGDKVLIVGGFVKGAASKSAEILDLKTGQFRKVADKMFDARGYHTANLIGNSRVLILGGYNSSSHGLNTAEIFNLETLAFERVELNLEHARGEHKTFKIDSRTYLVVGGQTQFDKFSRINGEANYSTVEIEIVDIENLSATPVNTPMNQGRYGESITPFGNSKLLILGGNRSLYDYQRASILNF